MNELKRGVFKAFVKVDKHGNKTYRTNACKRCGGYGRVYFTNLEEGRCWDCGGSGIGPERNTIEYTSEQRQLRDEKRWAKRIATVEDQLKAMGFGSNGVGFRLLGETFSLREQIKDAGGVWNGRYWLMPEKPNFTDSEPVLASEATEVEEVGEYVKRRVVHWRNLWG